MNNLHFLLRIFALFLIGSSVSFAGFGDDSFSNPKRYESKSDSEETKNKQSEDETTQGQQVAEEAQGNNTQTMPFGDPFNTGVEPLTAPQGAMTIPGNNLAFVGQGSEMPVLQLHTGNTQQLTQNELNDQLINAAEMGNLENVESLLKRGANIDACNNYGETALDIAKQSGQSEVVKSLKEHTSA